MNHHHEILELQMRVSALEQRLMTSPLSDGIPEVQYIKRLVCEEFGFHDAAAMDSSSRAQPLAWARQIAMFLVHEHTGLGSVEIGVSFGDRDHATVLHAWKLVKARCELAPADAERVTSLSKRIRDRREQRKQEEAA